LLNNNNNNNINYNNKLININKRVTKTGQVGERKVKQFTGLQCLKGTNDALMLKNKSLSFDNEAIEHWATISSIGTSTNI